MEDAVRLPCIGGGRPQFLWLDLGSDAEPIGHGLIRLETLTAKILDQLLLVWCLVLAYVGPSDVPVPLTQGTTHPTQSDSADQGRQDRYAQPALSHCARRLRIRRRRAVDAHHPHGDATTAFVPGSS